MRKHRALMLLRTQYADPGPPKRKRQGPPPIRSRKTAPNNNHQADDYNIPPASPTSDDGFRSREAEKQASMLVINLNQKFNSVMEEASFVIDQVADAALAASLLRCLLECLAVTAEDMADRLPSPKGRGTR
jgi:hypothetical protein